VLDDLPDELVGDQLLKLLFRKGHSTELAELRVIIFLSQQANFIDGANVP